MAGWELAMGFVLGLIIIWYYAWRNTKYRIILDHGKNSETKNHWRCKTRTNIKRITSSKKRKHIYLDWPP